MSKKNNKKTKARQHAFDLEREREAVQKHKKTASKTEAKLATKPADLKKKKQKKGGIRIRKGVVVQGIKIKDAASKKKALKALAKRRASGPAAMEA